MAKYATLCREYEAGRRDCARGCVAGPGERRLRLRKFIRVYFGQMEKKTCGSLRAEFRLISYNTKPKPLKPMLAPWNIHANPKLSRNNH